MTCTVVPSFDHASDALPPPLLFFRHLHALSLSLSLSLSFFHPLTACFFNNLDQTQSRLWPWIWQVTVFLPIESPRTTSFGDMPKTSTWSPGCQGGKDTACLVIPWEERSLACMRVSLQIGKGKGKLFHFDPKASVNCAFLLNPRSLLF